MARSLDSCISLFICFFAANLAFTADSAYAEDIQSIKPTSFDLTELKKSSSDVCDYVSTAWSHGNQKEISFPKGSATIDGKTINFVVGWQGGTCGGDEIKAEGYEDILQSNDSNKLLEGLQFAGGPWECGWQTMIVPFRGQYYTVSSMHGIPNEVVGATSGLACKLEHHYEPHLVKNKFPAICEKFLKGTLEPNVKWNDLSSDERVHANSTETGSRGAGTATFDKAADVNFDGKKSLHIGHYNYMWSGGSGCEQSGVAILDDDKATDKAAESLIDYQHEWWNCNNANADLVQVNGVTYVEALGGEEIGEPGVLLQFTNGTFEPICRIDQGLTITPNRLNVHPN